MTPTRRPRVLVVDDDERSRRLMRELLQPVGCEVVLAASGAQALDCLEAGRWHAVFLDLRMPGEDGFATLKEIRDRWPLEQLPVVLVTAVDDEAARRRGLELRANEFLTKPVDGAELLARFGGLLAFRRAQEDLEAHVAELERVRMERDFLLGGVLPDLRGQLSSLDATLTAVAEEAADRGGPCELLLDSAVVARRAARFAAVVIDLSRLRAGELGIQSEPVDLAAVAAGRVQAHRSVARRAGLALATRLEAPAGRIVADAGLLSRVTDQLLALAFDRTPAGAQVEVAVTPEAAGGLRLEVRDQGPDPSPAERDRLLEAAGAQRGGDAQVRLAEATLAFCRRALAAMGGRLAIEIRSGRGVILAAVFPPVPAPASAAPAAAAAR